MTDATTLSTFDRVVAVFAKRLDGDVAKFTADADLFNDLDGDSLDRVELAMDLEEEFKVVIPDELFETSRTVGQFADVVDGRLRARDAGR